MTIVYAHRGAAAERPENTLPSFRRALELGADALETDVHLTADREIVAAHDEDGARMTGVARALRSATLAEIQSWDAGYGFVDAQGGRPFQRQGYRIPSLHELLSDLPAVRLNVDLKSEEPALVDRFIATVREHQAEDRVIAASFFRSALSYLRRAGWRGESSLSRAEFLYWGLVPSCLQRGKPVATRAQIPTHAGPLQLATQRKLQKLRKLGLGVDYWTINDANEARRLVALGVDGIMTDNPAGIVPVVRAAGG
ncbi:MAG TPA: glycerophosphodiester phosphodiesterase family protein [Polyangiaceae bacterium]|nr:glycerophosphodiester phosphodiesterase family protein [Polyangiaceae bacterium]